MRQLRRWRPALIWLIVVVGAGAVLIWQGAGGSIWALAMLLPLAWLLSPLAFPGTVTDAAAQARATAESGLVRIYVRPGNLFCILLRWRLRALARQAVWVDFWADPAAAKRVRDLNEGEELGPVVLVDDQVKRNPPAPWVAQRLVKFTAEA